MLRLRRYEQISVQNRRFRSKFQRGRLTQNFRQAQGSHPINHSSSHKTRLNDLSYGIKIWTDLYSVMSQYTRVTDEQTDGRTEFSSLDRVCISCSPVKIDQFSVKRSFAQTIHSEYSRQQPSLTTELNLTYFSHVRYILFGKTFNYSTHDISFWEFQVIFLAVSKCFVSLFIRHAEIHVPQQKSRTLLVSLQTKARDVVIA